MELFSSLAVPLCIAGILAYGLLQKTDLFPAFVKGAKDGLKTVISMVPPLVLFLTVLGMFRASGAMDALCWTLAPGAEKLGIPAELLPLAFLRPVSGSGSLAVFQGILEEHGPDSFLGRAASIIQSASETTFYTLTVYFGSAGVSRHRYALPCALAGDLAVVLCGVWLARLLF